MWHTQELLDTIRWMLAHNEKPGATQVSFYGFDVPYSLIPLDNVTGYLMKVDPARADQAESLYACSLRDRTDLSITRDQCQVNLQKAYDDLLGQQVMDERRSSAEEFAFALQNARIILQTYGLSSGDKGNADRNHSMAENVAWTLNQAGSNGKILVTGHNFDIDASSPLWKSLGSDLREQYGKEMVIIGSSFYDGAVNAVSFGNGQPTVNPVAPPPADSYEAYFHRASIPRFFLDLPTLEPGSSEANWMLGPHPFQFVSFLHCAEPDRCCYSARLPAGFDGMLYIDHTSPTHLLADRS